MRPRNRQQRWVRAVVYVLILLVVVGMVLSAVGTALAAPAGDAAARHPPADRGRPGSAPVARPPGRPASGQTGSVAFTTSPVASTTPGSSPPLTTSPASPAAPVVVLGTHNLTWGDLLALAGSDDGATAGSAAAVLDFAAANEPLNLAVRTPADRTCPADGWLTLAAGTRARAVEGAGTCTWPGTDASQQPSASQAPGWLPSRLSRAGVPVTAVGQGAELALSAPGTALEAALDQVRRSEAGLVLVDTTPESTRGAAPTAAHPDDASRLAALAQALSTTLASAPTGTRVVIASLADDSDPGPQVAVLPAGTISPRGSSGSLLVGASTHQPGLIQLTDLAPTLVEALTGGTADGFDGQALTLPASGDAADPAGGQTRAAPVPETDPASPAASTTSPGSPAASTTSTTSTTSPGLDRVSTLADDALHARASQRAVIPTSLLLTGVAALLLVWAAVALRDRRDDRGQQASGQNPHTRQHTDPRTSPDPSPNPTPEDGSRGAASSAPSRPSRPEAGAWPHGRSRARASQPSHSEADPTRRHAGDGRSGRSEPSAPPAPPGPLKPPGPPGTRHRATAASWLSWAAATTTAAPLSALLVNLVPWWRVGARDGSPSPWVVPTVLALIVVVSAALTALAASLPGLVALARRLVARRPVAPHTTAPQDSDSPPAPPLAQDHAERPRRHPVTQSRTHDAGTHPPHLLGAPTPGLVAYLLCAATATAWLADAALGAHLALNGPLGMNAVVAGRFYGVSNTAFALATGALLIAFALTWHLLGGGRRTALLVVGSLGGAALVVDAAPQLGADVGGTLALLPALVVLGAGLSGTRLTWLRWLAAVAAAAGVVAVLATVDYLRPAGQRTHLGRFAAQVADGTVLTTLSRKAYALVGPFMTSGAALAGLLAGAALAVVLVRWARRERRAWAAGTSPYAWLTAPPGAEQVPAGAGGTSGTAHGRGQEQVEGHAQRQPQEQGQVHGQDQSQAQGQAEGHGRGGATRPWLRPVLTALAVLTGVAVLVNDSGITMAGFTLAASAPALLALVVGGAAVPRPAGHRPPGAQSGSHSRQ